MGLFFKKNFKYKYYKNVIKIINHLKLLHQLIYKICTGDTVLLDWLYNFNEKMYESFCYRLTPVGGIVINEAS